MFTDELPPNLRLTWSKFLAHARRDNQPYALFVLESDRVLPGEALEELRRYPSEDCYVVPTSSGHNRLAFLVMLPENPESDANSILAYAKSHCRIATGQEPPRFALSGITYAGGDRTTDLETMTCASIHHAFELLDQSRRERKPIVKPLTRDIYA